MEWISACYYSRTVELVGICVIQVEITLIWKLGSAASLKCGNSYLSQVFLWDDAMDGFGWQLKDVLLRLRFFEEEDKTTAQSFTHYFI